MRDRKREYELLFIISPLRSSEDEIESAIAKVTQMIENVGGSINGIHQTAPWGRRKFAYPMREYAEGESSRRIVTEGYYVLVDCSLPTAQITELERVLKLSGVLLRYMLTLNTNQSAPVAPVEAESAEA